MPLRILRHPRAEVESFQVRGLLYWREAQENDRKVLLTLRDRHRQDPWPKIAASSRLGRSTGDQYYGSEVIRALENGQREYGLR